MISVDQIRAARALLNVSQADVAGWVGISKNALCAIESGASTPRPATAAAIQHQLEIRGVVFWESGVWMDDMQKSAFAHLARFAGKLSREDEDAPAPAKADRIPDRDTQYPEYCDYWALRIANAARKARGQPLLKSLDGEVDDESDQPEKSKKKRLKKIAEDDEDDAEEKDENSDDFDTSDTDKPRGAANPQPGETESQYWRRVDATARAITRAGARRRGKP